ncbi:MAG: hypothetical protein ACRDUA_07180, partial [Micromonosporaceae bacterium]
APPGHRSGYPEPAAFPQPPAPATGPPDGEAGRGEGWPDLDDGGSSPWRDRGDDAVTPFRRRKGGMVKRFGKLPVMLVVLLVVLGLLGGAGYWFWTNQDGGGESAEYFAELSVSSVISRVESEGFECIPGRTIAQCEKGITGADLSITVHFASETEVTKIEASGGTAAYSDDEASPEDLQAFFGMAAQLPHSGDRGSAAKAKAWVGDKVNKGGKKTFGAVRYEAAADQPLVTMSPA